MRQAIHDQIVTHLQGQSQSEWHLTTDIATAVGHTRQTVVKHLRALYRDGLVAWRRVGRANFWRPTNYLLAGKHPMAPQPTGLLTCPCCRQPTPDYDVMGTRYRCPHCHATYIYAFEDQLGDVLAEAGAHAYRTVLVSGTPGDVRIYAVFSP
jgi:hypothetical protein